VGEFVVANANGSDASIGFEEKRWAVAEKKRGHMYAPITRMILIPFSGQHQLLNTARVVCNE